MTTTAGHRRKTRVWLLAALAALAAPTAARAFEQVKLAMERALEERIQFALDKLLEPQQFLVIVKVEPFTVEELKQKDKAGSAGASTANQYVLPGIPERQTIEKLGGNKSGASGADMFYTSRPFIKRLSITLFLDKSVNTDTAQQVEILVKQMTDFDPGRNDQLKVSRMAGRKSSTASPTTARGDSPMGYFKVSVDQLKERKDFYWIMMVAVLVAGLIVFLYGPMLFFLRKFPRILQQAFPPDPNYRPPSAPSSGGGSSPVSAAPAVMSGGTLDFGGGGGAITLNIDNRPHEYMEIFLGEPEKQPFSFINEKDVVNILLLMKDEPPLHLAIITYYLRPDLAAAMISGLDTAIRKQVVEHLAAPQMLMRDEVKSLGQSLRQRVRGIIYGVDQYFAIYDSATPAAQGELLKALEAQTPALVEKMRNEMFTFEDLMALDSSALRVVFREVPLRTLATALMGAAVNMRDRVLSVLPSGASEIIRQEIEMNPVQSPKIIEDDRKKIVQVVRRLVWDKKIVMPPRQRGTRVAAPAAPVAPAAPAAPAAGPAAAH
jgi:hypothetical protein